MQTFRKLTTKDIQERLRFIYLEGIEGICLYYSHVNPYRGYFVVDQNKGEKMDDSNIEWVGNDMRSACKTFNSKVEQFFKANNPRRKK